MTAVVKSKHELALGDDLRLPRAIIGARTSILGQPGTGKTSTAVVLVEEAAAIGARFVVIDPTGAWYGLASSADGDGPGVDCAGNRVALTDSGRANAAWPTHAGTSREIQEAVMATLTPARQRILQVLIRTWPEPLTRQSLAEAVDVPASSGGFKNNLGAMRTQGVIIYPEQGAVRAADLLFVTQNGKGSR